MPILEGYMGQYINFGTIALVSKKRRLSQSFHCSHTQSMDEDEGSDKNLDMKLPCIHQAQHGCLSEAFVHNDMQ